MSYALLSHMGRVCAVQDGPFPTYPNGTLNITTTYPLGIMDLPHYTQLEVDGFWLALMVQKGDPCYYLDSKFYSREEVLVYVAEKAERETQKFLYEKDPEAYRNALIAAAHENRRAQEQGGFDFNGMWVPSDRESQSMVTGAVASAKDDPSFTTLWQITPSFFIPLNAQLIQLLGTAMRNHVNGSFRQQGELVNRILTATDFDTLYATGLRAPVQ